MREVSLQIARSDELDDWDLPSFYCECGRIGCSELLNGLPLTKFREIALTPNRLIVMSGHQMEDWDEIIDDSDGFLVVHRIEEAVSIANSDGPARMR